MGVNSMIINRHCTEVLGINITKLNSIEVHRVKVMNT